MKHILQLAARNARRNLRRTLLTLSTVMVGAAFTLVTLTFLRGVYGGMTADWAEAFGPVRVVTSEYAKKEVLQPLYANMDPIDEVLNQVRAVPGVRDASGVIRQGVIVTPAEAEELGDVGTLLLGGDETFFMSHVKPGADLVEGGWFSPEDAGDQIVLGRRVAQQLGVSASDEVVLMGADQDGSLAETRARVMGIVSGNSLLDAQSFVPLETARYMANIPDGGLEILVYPVDGSRSGVVVTADALRETLGDGYVIEPWMERSLWKTNLPIMDAIEWVLAAIVVFLMALAIFNTMTMSVLERTGEIGVLRAMGQKKGETILVFLAESLLIGLTGALVGVLVGLPFAYWLATQGVTFGQDVVDEVGDSLPMTATVYGNISLDAVLIALGCGIATALIGALLPALRASSIPPYEAMRSRR